MSPMIRFAGACRGCGRSIDQWLSLSLASVQGHPGRRVRCAAVGCRTTTWLPRHTEDGPVSDDRGRDDPWWVVDRDAAVTFDGEVVA